MGRTEVGIGISPGLRRGSQSQPDPWSSGVSGVTGPGALPSAPKNILFLGQSNVTAVQPTVGVSGMQQHLQGSPALLGYNEGTHGFSALLDDGAFIRTQGGATGGGIVATHFCRLIANQSGQPTRLFAAGYTSQGIAYFDPASLTKHIYGNGASHASLNNFQLTSQWVADSNVSLDLIILFQGEADAGATQAGWYVPARRLIEAWLVKHPRASVLVVKTIELTGGGTSYTGVRAGQDQLAADFAHVAILDNSDMSGKTAWYAGDGTAHYTIFAGYEEVALRIYAKLQGQTRANVSAVNHIDAAITWTHRFQYRHSVDPLDPALQVVAWQDDLAAISATAAGATCFGHVTNDVGIGTKRRPSCDIERSNSETMSVTLADATGCDRWTFFAVGRLESLQQTMYLLELRDGGAANRVACATQSTFDAAGVLLDTTATFFPGGTAGVSTASAFSWGFAYDGVGLLARYYVNGVRIAEVAVAGTAVPITPVLWIGALGPATPQDFFDGQLSLLSIASNVAANDAQFALMHAYAQVEFGI